ncbi:tetratricopeptide repeat protein [Mycobacterium sp. NPDC050041]|uniref:serine/threonine-protein kinase n=1 Tax=Mycobacterium sp. NPDC050041 TaxID=3364293 RepID=UPI003C2B761D
MICAESGCTGTVVDGYCDVCGTAPTPQVQTAPGAPSSTAAMPSTARSARSRRTTSTSTVSARGGLGAGIIDIPRIPKGDPAAAILPDPQVPEAHRFCGNSDCGRPVGRGTDGTPGRTSGFCTHCGTRYSFVPRLCRGDLIGGQYEVQGCIAHGGLGWIYLATDNNVHGRHVVLKGLVHSGDVDAMAAAAAEAHALAEVEHPNIVRIHNFVEHVDDTGSPVGYIVMEYVGGTSLKQIRRAHGGPLPPEQAVAYIVEIAPAIGHLHAQGLAYCDFKPDNVMQTDEQVKLIDLGAVVDMDDDDCAIYGTAGYQAPEIAWTGPTVASDIYTVGRALAVLVMDVPQESGRPAPRLPGPDDVPVLAEHPSLHRCILRATDPDPARRFASMEELADQLTGVLYEIAAAGGTVVQPRKSSHFSHQRGIFGAAHDAAIVPAEVVAALAVPVVDPRDSGAAVLATTSGTPPAQLENALWLAQGGAHGGGSSSVEIPLRLVRAALEIGNPGDARKRLAELRSVLQDDWRLSWYLGQCALLEREYDEAGARFDEVLAVLPGELAPKLAAAAAAELRGAYDVAVRHYETVWRTDDSYVSAAFGCARLHALSGDKAGAVAALDRVPEASAHCAPAGATAIGILLDGLEPDELDETTLHDAAKRTCALNLESAARRASIRLKVLDAALRWLDAGNKPTAFRLLNVDFDEQGVRAGIETCYRVLARDAVDVWERIALVERANAIRPRTRT